MEDRQHRVVTAQGIGDDIGQAGDGLLIGAADTAGMARREIGNPSDIGWWSVGTRSWQQPCSVWRLFSLIILYRADRFQRTTPQRKAPARDVRAGAKFTVP